MSSTFQTTQLNSSSLLNNFFGQDFMMSYEEQPMPCIDDDIIAHQKPREDAQWAFVDQDESIRQQHGGLFDLEKEYRSIEKFAESVNETQEQELFQAPVEAAAWEYKQLNENVAEEPSSNDEFGYPMKSFALLKDNKSVANDKSLDTTHTNMLSDDESSEASQQGSQNGADYLSSALNLTRTESTQYGASNISRRVSLELEECSIYKYDTTYSRRGRKSDDQLKQLMNIYIENGGRMTKQMLQEAAVQSGLKRLQVYKWYWDLERKKSHDMKTQKTMYPSLIFKVTKFGQDITQPIRRPLFKVERNARRNNKEESANTTQSFGSL